MSVSLRVQVESVDRVRLGLLHSRIDDELETIVAALYEALVQAADGERMIGGSESSARVFAILLDWLRGLACDTPPSSRLLDEHSALTGWLVSKLVTGGMHHMRVAYKRIAGDDPDFICSIDRVLDAELGALVQRREADLAEQFAMRALGDRMAAMQRMTAGFAQQLRNPVNAARLQIALHATAAPSSGDEPTSVALAALDAITELLDEFLLFARPSPAAGETLDVVAVVRGAVAEEGAFARANGIELQFTSNLEAASRSVDGSKLAYIVAELVHNAVEAGLPGGRVVIELRVDQALHVGVLDNGVGIAPEHRTKIFEPFFSTRGHGRGLGLAIVYTFIKSCGGAIELTIAPGKTSFAVTLPGA